MDDVKVKLDRPSRAFLIIATCLLIILGFLFAESFLPNQVVFSNDGPLGVNVSAAARFPEAFTGWWDDLNWLGFEIPSPTPNFSSALRLLIGPYYYAKFYPFACLFALGLSAWFFFRTLRFHRAVCVLGGIAAALNGNFLSNMAWGQGSRPLSLAASFLALAALQSARLRFSWIKIVLAGLAVGLAVTEGYDVGAIFSLYIAAFVLFAAWVTEGPVGKKVGRGVASLVLVVVCAGLFATQTIVGLVGTQIKGVAMLEKAATPEEKAAKWDFATQWSIAKLETLRVVIPGLFGYRMTDRSGHVYPKSYWGRVGQTPGNPASRFNGSAENAGVLVVLMAVYALASALRKNGTMPTSDKKFIWFWSILALLSLFLAWGRFAPFYQFFYALPHADTIRNPMKFMHPFHFAILILFGYGLQALYREYIERSVAKTDSVTHQIKKWWAKAMPFERKWQIGVGATVAISFLAALIYAGSKRDLEKVLQTNGFDPAQAPAIASYSIMEVWVFGLFLAIAAFLVAAVMSGWFSGQRAKWAGIFMGLFLAVDLGRADKPWIIYWDAKQKYETNPILETLKDKPYEHRVIMLPFQIPQMQMLSQLYGIELLQQLFQYHDIQSLDVIQEPRAASETTKYRRNFGSAEKLVREWQLTNTKFFFGMNGQFITMLNQQLDPVQKRFKIHTPFKIVAKSGIAQPDKLEELTMTPDPNGEFALIEFTGALPRAKLYSNWEISTNSDDTLKTLADPAFDPASKVILEKVDTTIPAPAPGATAEVGTVAIQSYSPKKIVLTADASSPCMLLLNDADSPNWHATIDGTPAKIYRGNYLMRAVYLTPGKHTIQFAFEPSRKFLYISTATVLLGLLLLGVLAVMPKRNETQVETV